MISKTFDRVMFATLYKFPDEVLVSTSVLRFAAKGDIERMLGSAGLWSEAVLGDWEGSEFISATSQEMIFKVRLDADILIHKGEPSV